MSGMRSPARQSGFSVGIGIFTGQTRPGSGIGVSDEYRGIMSMARAADEKGFDSFWLSEHHGAEDNYLPSLLPMAAAVAAATERIRIGTAILIPAFQDPIRLAEDVAVVDQLSQGRFILGLGLGWRNEEFETFGVRRAERAGRTAEAISFLRHAWSGAAGPFEGGYYRCEKPRVRPLPFTAGGPPIYLAGSREKPIRRAAALADGLIYSVTGPTAAAVQPDLTHIERALDAVDEERGQTSLDSDFPITLLLNAAVTTDGEMAEIEAGVDHQYVTYARWKREDEGLPFGADDHRAAVAAGRKLILSGDPNSICARLSRWVEAIAARAPLHLVVKLHYPGVPAAMTVAAMKLFASQVMPVLRQRAETARLDGPRPMTA